MMSQKRQYCTFFVDGIFLGIEVLKVQEVIRFQSMTRVPLASNVVRGLINLRGQIVTAIDLRRRLNLKDREAGKQPMNVVVRSDDGVVSFLVDEIGDVIEVDDSQYEPPIETMQGVSKELILGVYKLRDRLLLVLDSDQAAAVFSLKGEAA